IIICICSSVALFQYRPSKNGQTSTSTPLEKHTALKIIENINSQPLTIVLSDSSSVVLFPGSSLSFKESFDLTYRSLTLIGGARFKVARDTARPFTVYANGVATTALGTDFTINTLPGLNKVRVRLSEGEVVIRSFFKNMRRKDIYLKPGQECSVDIHSEETLIRKYKINKAYHGKNKNGFRNNNSTSLAFNKESLTTIFEKLSKCFNTEIRCDKRALRNLSFTGSFNPTDSLPMILTVVCSTNDLFFERNGAVITVRKQ
ncbi:MAG TPA: FecR family protein, partial [Flavitalea sp.]|nr:FecR family protein [Flavitalea sp.]